MIKIFLTLFFLISSNLVLSQVNTAKMTCIPNNPDKIPFTVQFFGNKAMATFKGYSHTALFTQSYVSKNGDTWFVYQSNGFDISTTPYDKYVSIGTISPNGVYESISGAKCS
jgi:hypothetical protein